MSEALAAACEIAIELDRFWNAKTSTVLRLVFDTAAVR